MNIECPNCSTRYRLDPASFPKRRLRLRCASCTRVFRVEVSRADQRRQQQGVSTEALMWARRVARTLIQDLVHYESHDLENGRELAESLSAAKSVYREQVGSTSVTESAFQDIVAEMID